MRARRHLNSTKQRSGRGTPARPGLTFLEVVLATVILASVVAIVMSALNFVMGQTERQLAKLGAMELANRLMIIFLDDELEFGRQPRNLEFQGRSFRWDYGTSGVAVLPVVEGDSVTAIRSAERLRNVEINVWLAAESGGSDRPDPAVPSARVVRLVDILYMNPDSIDHMMGDDQSRQEFIRRAMESRSGGASRPATKGRESGAGSRPDSRGGSSSKSGSGLAPTGSPTPASRSREGGRR